jgi:hypothetical protein
LIVEVAPRSMIDQIVCSEFREELPNSHLVRIIVIDDQLSGWREIMRDRRGIRCNLSLDQVCQCITFKAPVCQVTYWVCSCIRKQFSSAASLGVASDDDCVVLNCVNCVKAIQLPL